MELSRRRYLGATGGALVAAAGLSRLADPAEGRNDDGEDGKKHGDVLYGHGLVWNRALSGIAAQLNLSFELRVSLETGTGFGTAEDPVHPDWNFHFAINSAEQEKRPKGETRFTLHGVVTEATNVANVGLPVTILAETSGDATAVAIRLGDLAFAGAGLVVIAIIAVLISLLLPAVQSAR